MATSSVIVRRERDLDGEIAALNAGNLERQQRIQEILQRNIEAGARLEKEKCSKHVRIPSNPVVELPERSPLLQENSKATADSQSKSKAPFFKQKQTEVLDPLHHTYEAYIESVQRRNKESEFKSKFRSHLKTKNDPFASSKSLKPPADSSKFSKSTSAIKLMPNPTLVESSIIPLQQQLLSTNLKKSSLSSKDQKLSGIGVIMKPDSRDEKDRSLVVMTSIDKSVESSVRMRKPAKKKEDNPTSEAVSLLISELDPTNLGVIAKSELISFFFAHKEYLELFDLDPYLIVEEIDEEKSEDFFRMTTLEFRRFIMRPRSKVSLEIIDFFYKSHKETTSPNSADQEESEEKEEVLNDPETKFKKINRYFLLKQETTRLLAEVWEDGIKEKHNGEEENEEETMNVDTFLQKLLLDKRVQDVGHEVIQYVTPVHDKVRLWQILMEMFILIDGNRRKSLTAGGSAKKVAKVITWPEFLLSLQNHRRLQNLTYMDVGNKEEDEDFSRIDCHYSIMKCIKEIFEKEAAKMEGYVDTLELVFRLRTSNSIRNHLGQVARRSFKGMSMMTETLDQLLSRVSLGAPRFLLWNEFIQFFTKRGSIYDITRQGATDQLFLDKNRLKQEEINRNDNIFTDLIFEANADETGDKKKDEVEQMKTIHKLILDERPFGEICSSISSFEFEMETSLGLREQR